MACKSVMERNLLPAGLFAKDKYSDKKLKAHAKELKAAVKLTEKEATAKWMFLNGEKAAPRKAGEKLLYEDIAKGLKAAVKLGKLTEAKAVGIWKKYTGEGKSKNPRGDSKKDEYLEAVAKKLKAAVKAGKLTEKEAWAKWKAMAGEKKRK